VSEDLQQKLRGLREQNPWIDNMRTCQCAVCKEEDQCPRQAANAKYKKLEQDFKVLDEELYRLEKKDIDATCQGIRADKAEAKVTELVGALEQLKD